MYTIAFKGVSKRKIDVTLSLPISPTQHEYINSFSVFVESNFSFISYHHHEFPKKSRPRKHLNVCLYQYGCMSIYVRKSFLMVIKNLKIKNLYHTNSDRSVRWKCKTSKSLCCACDRKLPHSIPFTIYYLIIIL